MTTIKSRFVASYKPNGRSPGFGTFGEFMVSPQVRHPVTLAAVDIMNLARTLSPRSKRQRTDDDGPAYRDGFRLHSKGLQTQVGKRRAPRVMVQISNVSQHAVPVEFGSGPPAEGASSGQERPQGGWNKAARPLGRAGRKIGRAFE